MYKIKADGQGGYTIHIPSADALAKLLRGQTYSMTMADGNRMLTYVEAQQIARDAGRDVPSSSLRSACQRGTILGAIKRKGRWTMPENEFRAWADIPTPSPAPRQRSDEEILFGNPLH